jgi:alanyl-tRNA synthetase
MTMTEIHSENETPAPTTPSEKDTVSYETHRRLLDEKKKLQAKLAEIETSKRAQEEEELSRKGETQKLLELAKKEAEELRVKLTAKEQREVQAKKLSAVIRGLGSNVDEKWFGVIGQQLDDVVYNAETGEIEQMSVTSIVEDLKKTWPEMLKRTPVGMPNDAPKGGGPTTIERSEWLKLSAKEMQKYRPDQVIG